MTHLAARHGGISVAFEVESAAAVVRPGRKKEEGNDPLVKIVLGLTPSVSRTSLAGWAVQHSGGHKEEG
jgi:hypothetical protein